jgi:hypothetical protein
MRNDKSLILLSIICISLVMSSCASVFQGTTKKLSVNSTTKGAKIYVDGAFVGEDSVNVELKRSKDHSVVVEKDGFRSEKRNVISHFQAAWLIPDILFAWGLTLVDVFSSAWFSFSPDSVTVELEPEQKK